MNAPFLFETETPALAESHLGFGLKKRIPVQFFGDGQVEKRGPQLSGGAGWVQGWCICVCRVYINIYNLCISISIYLFKQGKKEN